MFICLLCSKEIGGNAKGVELSRKLNERLKFIDAISEQISSLKNLINPTQLSCSPCFNIFKSFYNLVDLANKNYLTPDIKIEAIPFEIIEEKPLKRELKVQLERIKIEPEIKILDELGESIIKVSNYSKFSDKDSFQDTKENPWKNFEEDSDFEWEMSEDEWGVNFNESIDSFSDNFENPVEFNIEPKVKIEDQNVNLKNEDSINFNLSSEKEANIKIESNELPLKKRAASKTSKYIRYLPRSKVTPEMLKSGQEFIIIDGIEFKIPKQKYTSEKRKKVFHGKYSDDPDRRKHPCYDHENEQKIRDSIDVKCHICETKFESFSKVKKHFKLHHENVKAFLICCNKKFMRRSSLLDHLEWHDKSVVYRCEICMKEYKNKACLVSHNRLLHSNVNRTSICAQCGQIFSSEQSMKTHAKKHEVSFRNFLNFKFKFSSSGGSNENFRVLHLR